MAARKTPTELAVEALDRIAKHEKQCGERWAEATTVLRRLEIQVQSHAARWEKLAWYLIVTVGGGVAATLARAYF